MDVLRSNPGLVVDIVIGLVALISVIVGAKKGLFKSVLSIAAVIVALLLALVLSGPLSTPVTKWVYPKVADKIEPAIESVTGISVANIGDKISAILSNMGEDELKAISEMDDEAQDTVRELIKNNIPDDIKELAAQYGIDIDSLLDNLVEGTDELLPKIQQMADEILNGKTPDTQETEISVINAAGMAVLKPLVRVALGILLFIVLKLIFKIIIHFLSKAVETIPVVKSINALGGAVLSLAKVAIVVYLLVFIIVRLNLTQYTGAFTEDSVIFAFIAKMVPAAL